MPRQPIHRVDALLDWNNLQSRIGSSYPASARNRLQVILAMAQEEIAHVLKRRDTAKRYRVRTRIYDGWHKRKNSTQIRVEFDKYMNNLSDRSIGSVSFTAEFGFGNEMLCVSEFGPLWHTFREGKQKMVDTALVCDALHSLVEEQADSVMVLSDDDDFVPLAFTSLALGREALLLRVGRRDLSEVSDVSNFQNIYYWGDR